ncbi:hypothetical protein [Rufibacter roseus]|uniref:Uncharacterized protein n=1 Tax=Rufibacter roseus TaxID=1567108 RepID=A0ABW2DRD2_9BACT|nr:hypothetical protein [Rufibacter roseus]
MSVKQNSSVDYSLGTLSVEAGAVVEMHPAHAEVSELVREQTGEIKYKYKPQPGFKGKDYVQIRFAKGTNGTSESTLIKITKINLIVEE